MLHKIIFVAHSVAQIGAKTAQNSPFRCSTVYRKLLICFRWGYYLANFKTAGFNRSPTPPFLSIAYTLVETANCDSSGRNPQNANAVTPWKKRPSI